MNITEYKLSNVLRRNYRGFVVGAVLVVMTVCIQLGMPFIVRHLIDELTVGNLTRRELLAWVAFYAACIPPAAAISYWMRRLPLRNGHKVEYTIRRDLFEHLSRQDAAFYNQNRIGDLMTRSSTDIALVRDALGHGILHGTRALISLLLAFSVLSRMHVALAAVLLGLMLCMLFSFSLLLGVIRRRHAKLQEQTSHLGSVVEETFSGIRTIKGFALEQLRNRMFAGENDEMRNCSMRLSLVSEPIWPLFAFWFALQMTVTLVYGGRLVLDQAITLGDLVLVTQYLLFMQWPVLSLGWISNMLQRARISWGRVQALFSAVPQIRDTEKTDFSITALQGGIEFRNVSLRLGGRTVLDGISLKIPAGMTVGITGPTGAGKSLLTALVARLCEPDEGAVLIDGHPLERIPLAVLRQHIGFVPQQPILFSDTLAHNLAFGVDDASDEQIAAAARIACLEDEIKVFPKGYATMIGERGVTLSGGQRQRAALGRAVARQAAILVLDDALAAVDTHTEASIIGQLESFTSGRTTLLVSHRLAALYRADQIVVLSNGRITEQGTHAELLAVGGYYAETYRLQQLEAGAVPADAREGRLS